jgi:ubiquinone/menaquinone biosynthesis C-methylase UbiE
MAAQYGRLDPWTNTAPMAIEQARHLASLLDRRAQSEQETGARAAYLDLLAIGPGERVLEVGCGHGIVLREVARRVGPAGRAVGLDPGRAFLTVAREQADQADWGNQVELREGDVQALPFSDAEFDVVLAATTLAHVPDGPRAIGEMVRVLRPGGRIGVFEQDTDSYLIAHPDRALTRRVVAAYTDHGYADGWLARGLPHLLTEAGVHDVHVRAFATVETDIEGFYSTRAERAADAAVRAGAISEEERQRWLEAVHNQRASGSFVAGLTFLFVWGSRA